MIDFGICLIMEGGWFEWLLTYCGWLLGFLKGANLALLRFRVMSRKLTIWWLTCAVMFNPICWKGVPVSLYNSCLVQGNCCRYWSKIHISDTDI